MIVTPARAAAVSLAMLALVLSMPAPAQESSDAEPAPAAADTTIVAGRVVDGDGEAVAGATVTVVAVPAPRKDGADADAGEAPGAPARVEATTGEDGSFSAEVARATRVFVRVVAQGAAPSTTSLEVPFDPPTIQLGRGTTVRVRLLEVTSGRPAAGVEVRLEGRFESWIDEPRTYASDDEGRIVMPDVPSDGALLRVEAHGYRSVARPLEVPEPAGDAGSDPAVDLGDIYLEPGGTIAGIVVDAEGEPLGGLQVTAEDADPMRGAREGAAVATARTGDDGRFTLSGLPADRSYVVTATGAGIATVSRGPLALERGKNVDGLRLRAGSGGTLAMRLVGPDGPPPADAVRVRLRQTDAADFERSTRATAPPDDRIDVRDSGRVRISTLTPGDYDVVVDVDGFRRELIDGVEVRDGRTRDLGEVVLDPGKWIAGRVVDAEGRAVRDARVVAYWRDDRESGSRTTRSAEDGSFRILGLGDDPVRWIQADRDGASSEQIRGVAPGVDDLTLALRPLGSITGRVRLERGGVPETFEARAVSGRSAGPFAAASGLLGGSWTSYSGADGGRFTIADARAGSTTLEVRAPGTTVARVGPLDVRAEESTDVGEIVLSPGAVLRGRVIDGDVDAPVAGATVTAGPAGTMGMVARMAGGQPAARTDTAGEFEIDGLEPGRLTVTAQHPDYATVGTDVTIEAAVPTREVELRLSRGGTLTGTVRDADGLPVPGARLVIAQGFGNAASAPQFVTTSEDGTYRLDRLPPGTCVVARVPENAGRSIAGLDMRQATITAGGVTVVDFDERPAITLHGRVLRGDEPVGGAALVFVPSGQGATLDISSVQSDEDGWFEVGLENAGTYVVQVIAEADTRRQMGNAQIEVPDEAVVEQDIVLSSAAIRGVVVDRDGVPVEGAQITATPPTAGSPLLQSGGSALSDADGGFEIGGLRDETYSVVATAEGFATAPAVAVTASAGAGDPVEIVLDRGRRVRGQVVDPSGAPVAGAMVWAAPAGSAGAFPASPSSSDGAGMFEVLAPESGPATVTVGGTAWAPAIVPIPPGADDGSFVVRLGDGGTLLVTVVGEDGAPRPGMTVSAVPVDPAVRVAMVTSMRMAGSTDDAGRAELTRLAPSAYTVEVFGGGAPPVVATVTDGATTSVTITVP